MATDERLERGTLKLEMPLTLDDDRVLDELKYDFGNVTGTLLLSVLGSSEAGAFSTRHALNLFLCACAPEENGGLTRDEIRTRLTAGDILGAQMLGAGFFRARSASALTRIVAR